MPIQGNERMLKMKAKKLSVLILVVALGFSLTGNATTAGKLTIVPNGGIILPVNGAFDSHDDLKDVVGAGPSFGLGLRYGLNNSFSVEGAFSWQWMNVEDDYKTISSKDPAFVLPALTLNGIYHLGPAMGSETVSPFLTVGVGLYPWKLSEDGATGDAVVAPYDASEDFSKNSFGFNVGAGLDYFFTDQLALNVGTRYIFVMSEDEDMFGSDFGNQGFLKINLGLLYCFPLGN